VLALDPGFSIYVTVAGNFLALWLSLVDIVLRLATSLIGPLRAGDGGLKGEGSACQVFEFKETAGSSFPRCSDVVACFPSIVYRNHGN